jgi:uncharacterized protein (TIGR03437 family)
VFRSTDGGQTWTASTFNGIAPIAVDSSSSNIIYVQAAGSAGGLSRSADSGATWGPTSLTGEVVSIRTDAAAPGVVLAITKNVQNTIELDRSTDFGATWTLITTDPGYFIPAKLGPQGTAWDVTFDGKNPNALYIAGGGSCGPAGQTQCYLPRSADGGKTWQTSTVTGNFGNILMDPRNGNIFAGGLSVRDPVSGKTTGEVVKSSDGGKSWTAFTKGLLTHGAQVHIDPESESVLYANQWMLEADINAAGGVFVSTDGGQSWTLTAVSPPASGVTITQYQVYSLQAVSDKNAPQPSISQNGVVNGASFQPTIVPNSWATIFGTGLASVTDDWSKSIVNGQFPTVLDGVSVTVGGKRAYVYYITPSQLNVLVPDIGSGQMPVTVTNSSGTSTAFTVASSLYGPAFFAWPNNQPVATRQDFSLSAKNGTFAGAATVAAKPGDIIILWGTGFGPTVPAAPAGVAVPSGATYSTATLPTVTINNVPATVFGAALAPGFAGLYQVAIQVPSSIADGDWPIQATIGGVPSPTGVLLSVRH